MISHLGFPDSWQKILNFSKQLLLAILQSSSAEGNRYSYMYMLYLTYPTKSYKPSFSRKVAFTLCLKRIPIPSFYLQWFTFSVLMLTLWQIKVTNAFHFSHPLILLPPSFPSPPSPSLVHSQNQTSHRSQSCSIGGEMSFLLEPLMCIIMQSVPTGSCKSADLLWEERRGFKIQGQFIITARVLQDTKWGLDVVVCCRTVVQ